MRVHFHMLIAQEKKRWIEMEAAEKIYCRAAVRLGVERGWEV